MKMRNEIRRIIEMANAEGTSTLNLGIRGEYSNITHELGEILGTSYGWDWENDCTDYENNLGGICTVDCTPDWLGRLEEEEIEEAVNMIIDRIEFARVEYRLDNYYLVKSYSRNPLDKLENDQYEAILEDAEVIAVL